MEKFQFFAFFKKPVSILALILTIFFLKGVFLASITPIFVGQDEARHYSSIQYLSEQRPVTWPIVERKIEDKNSIQRFNYSQEVLETAKAIDYDNATEYLYNTFSFIQGHDGKNESKIINNDWHQYNEYYPPNKVGKKSIYHNLLTVIEKSFGDQNILVRYYLIRIFSVFLGTLFILFSYFITKNIGFSAKNSLLLTAIVSFQPRFSIYYTTINSDALLILTFALFTLGGILALKNGLSWKNIFLIVFSILLGILTKPTASVLLIGAALLFMYFLYEKVKNKNRKIKYIALLIFACITASLLIYFKKYLPDNISNICNLFISVKDYLSKTLTIGRFGLSSRTYWGILSWTKNWSINNGTNIIWLIQAIAAVGIAFFLFSKKKFAHLPEKKYIVFLLMMLALLQLGIRFADWMFFYNNGGHIETGTPGRYFIPNLTAHIILVFTGIGILLEKTSVRDGSASNGQKYFEYSLIIGLVLMMTFMLYIIFDNIIFRYYL